MTLAEIVQAKEEELWTQRIEVGVFYDAMDKVVLEKSAQIGNEYEITFTEDEIAAVKSAHAILFTHNHPRGWKYALSDPRHAGTSFSPHDLHLACQCRLLEIHAVSPGYTFCLTASTGAFQESDWPAIRFLFDLEYDKVKREWLALELQGRQSRLESVANELHETWTRIAPLLGLVYNRTEEG